LPIRTNGHYTNVNLSIHLVATDTANISESMLYLVILEEVIYSSSQQVSNDDFFAMNKIDGLGHNQISISKNLIVNWELVSKTKTITIIEKIDNYITELKRVETEGEIIAIDFFVDTEAYKKFYERVYTEYVRSSEEQKEKLHELLKMACYISIPFYFMFIVLLGYGAYNRKKIKCHYLVQLVIIL
jgi:hypothetical protein